MGQKLYLIDGHALIFKMHYAFVGRPMVNSRGENTSIIYGFTKYLLELLDHYRPSHIGVSFDPPGGSFRNELYPLYKANRGETPAEVIAALEPLTLILRAMNIPVLMLSGFEADDVIGSAARRFACGDMDVYMVTPDKDYGQLVSPHIFQFKPGKSGSENEVLSEAEVCDKWKISSTSQVIDMLALCGDSSDNVPGVQGVGPVGAAKLLAKYSSVEGIYEHLDSLTARQRESFLAARDHIALSKQLVTIKTDIPLEWNKEDFVLDTVFNSELGDLLDRYEMPSLKRLVDKVVSFAAPQQGPRPAEAEIGSLRVSEPAALCPEGKVAVALAPQKGSLAVCDCGKYAVAPAARFAALLSDESVVKICEDSKALISSLAGSPVELKGQVLDVTLMHYVLNPEKSHKLEDICQEYLGRGVGQQKEMEQQSLFDEMDSEPEAPSSLGDSLACTYALGVKLHSALEESPELLELYLKVEAPLAGVLSAMERRGVKIDTAALEDYGQSLRKRMEEQERQVRQIAEDEQFNIMSVRQVGELVFEKLKLDPGAKKPRKGSWPTDEKTLAALSDRSPVIDHILEYRGLRKLLSTYIEPLAGYVSPLDGRVHTTFNQALTSTGRLSSSNPNLQNIPIRTPDGQPLRRAFVSGDEGSVIMSADYSQIELRLMAHLSGDEHLKEAFRQGLDIHKATASKIFGVPLQEVSAEQRRVAKTANFGIIYGISAFGLSQNLGCSRSEAASIIEDYFASFPTIRDFIDSTLRSARQNGYVQTIFKRRRYIPDINSTNAALRSVAERNAVNAPVQGSAADIIKLAMIGVDEALKQQGLKSFMVLQIHDELLLEVRREEIEAVRTLLREKMEGAASLSVPLTIECNYGQNWLDAH